MRNRVRLLPRVVAGHSAVFLIFPRTLSLEWQRVEATLGQELQAEDARLRTYRDSAAFRTRRELAALRLTYVEEARRLTRSIDAFVARASADGISTFFELM